jgi:hypothetical protein
MLGKKTREELCHCPVETFLKIRMQKSLIHSLIKATHILLSNQTIA